MTDSSCPICHLGPATTRVTRTVLVDGAPTQLRMSVAMASQLTAFLERERLLDSQRRAARCFHRHRRALAWRARQARSPHANGHSLALLRLLYLPCAPTDA